MSFAIRSRGEENRREYWTTTEIAKAQRTVRRWRPPGGRQYNTVQYSFVNPHCPITPKNNKNPHRISPFDSSPTTGTASCLEL